MSSDKKVKTLTDAEITTGHPSGRRRFMGLMAAGGAVGAAVSLMPGEVMAQAGDGDNGAWRDNAGCNRGQGGVSTGLNDADTGSITDVGGSSRGAPYC